MKSQDLGRPAGEEAIALLVAIADVLARRALDHPWRRSELSKAVNAIAEMTGLSPAVVRSEVHARVARDPRLVQLSPAVAIETQLKMLHAFTDVEHVSLWTSDPLNGLRSRFHVGRGKRERAARLVARSVLDGAQAERSGSTHGVPVLRWQRPDGALVFDVNGGNAQVCSAAARSACSALALVLEREALLVRSTARERALVEPRERLVTRLGFDLHDGPIQDVAALAADIRLLRTQLDDVLVATGAPAGLFGRVDDLEARVHAVDRGLRHMVHSLESPGVTRRPLDEALRRETEAFEEETDVQPDLVVRGDVTTLTDSQRIAIIRIVQESLTNIREHAHASRVSVAVMAGPSEITVEVNDDGRGFDVDRTLVRSARAGRLGLLGMSERVRLLGGRFDVRSRTGGPTTVSAILPAWRPAGLEPAALTETGSAV
jgi:signal transduction histidine kinase